MDTKISQENKTKQFNSNYSLKSFWIQWDAKVINLINSDFPV